VRLRRSEAGSRSEEPEADVTPDHMTRRACGIAEIGDALSVHAASELGVWHHVDQLLNVDYLYVELLEIERYQGDLLTSRKSMLTIAIWK
jgi:hypothetical protein